MGIKSRGICFYIDYGGPAPLLATALHSLSKWYHGNVHVVYGKNTPDAFVRQLSLNKRITSSYLDKQYEGSGWGRTSSRCWNLKPVVHAFCPFELNLLYDCDHVFIKDYDESAFDLIEQHGRISFNYQWEEQPPRHQARANMRAGIVRDKIKLDCLRLPCVNGGCVGSAKGTPLLAEWREALEKFASCGDGNITRLPDEFSLSYVMQKYKVPIGDKKWSFTTSPKRPDELKTLSPEVMAVHFAAGAFRSHTMFQDALRAAWEANYMGLESYRTDYLQWNDCMKILPV